MGVYRVRRLFSKRRSSDRFEGSSIEGNITYNIRTYIPKYSYFKIPTAYLESNFMPKAIQYEMML